MEVPYCVLLGSGFLWKTVLVKKKHERFEVYKKDSGEISHLVQKYWAYVPIMYT